jgi:alpha-L-fucosidase
MGWPEKDATMPALGTQAGAGKIRDVSLLGFKGKVSWKQEAGGLRIQLPAEKPCEHAIVFKVVGA